MTSQNESIYANTKDFVYPKDMPKEWVDKCLLMMSSLGVGLTKREYFAAMAFSSIVRDKHHFYLYADGEAEESNSPEVYARCAVYMADTLIAELNKK